MSGTEIPDAAAFVTPPEGWFGFGAHADPDACSYPGTLTFSDERGEDGFPLWERHDGCTLPAKASDLDWTPPVVPPEPKVAGGLLQPWHEQSKASEVQNGTNS